MPGTIMRLATVSLTVMAGASLAACGSARQAGGMVATELASEHMAWQAPSSMGSKPHTTVRAVDSAAVIARLAGLLNGLHADPGGPRSCPAIVTTYTLAFSTAPAARPYLVATVTSCGVVGVTADGKPQPALDNRGDRVLVAIRGLLESRA
jgi:hypothetical protein